MKETQLTVYVHAAGASDFKPTVTRYFSQHEEAMHVNLTPDVAVFLKPDQLVQFRDVLTAAIVDCKLEGRPIPQSDQLIPAMIRDAHDKLSGALTLLTDRDFVHASMVEPAPVEPPAFPAPINLSTEF
jgi:hypothetical protein